MGNASRCMLGMDLFYHPGMVSPGKGRCAGGEPRSPGKRGWEPAPGMAIVKTKTVCSTGKLLKWLKRPGCRSGAGGKLG